MQSRKLQIAINSIKLIFLIAALILPSKNFAGERKKPISNSIYIIQIGYFKSSFNANQALQSIVLADDEFSIVKKKRGVDYVIFFDDIKTKQDADTLAEKLKALNPNMIFFVKKKK